MVRIFLAYNDIVLLLYLRVVDAYKVVFEVYMMSGLEVVAPIIKTIKLAHWTDSAGRVHLSVSVVRKLDR